MENYRLYWTDTMIKIASPVLYALEKRQLKTVMPIGKEAQPNVKRKNFTHLEALARTLVGMAPWLEKVVIQEKEDHMRNHFCNLAREAIDAGTNPQSPDYMNFENDFQPIVDAAFLAQALLRAPIELWDKLGGSVKDNVILALKATRSRKPPFNNWLLFSAVIEAALYKFGEKDWDPMRIDYAMKQLEQWYLGDGVYSDGPVFHYDYYNSFVIHPMLVDLAETVGNEYPEWKEKKEKIITRSRRYAIIQERLISPEGTFPPIGRSLTYRTGAFQSLAYHALRDDMPEDITPAQVRSGLTAVIEKTLGAPHTFTNDGWLTIGLHNHQQNIGESYISTGSLYLCTAVFLPLGLPESHSFWSDPPAEWTAKKIWSGKEVPIDKALHE